MKKFLILILFAVVSIYCRAAFPFSEVNNTWNISLVGGYVGYSDDINYGAIGVSVTIKGFYVDLMGFPAIHGDDVRVDKWDDKKSFLCHVGYQVPIIKSLRIIPVVGYSYISRGITDGWDWSAGGSGINNKYHSLQSISRFDYGGIVVLNYKRTVFSIGATRSCLFGGIGIEI